MPSGTQPPFPPWQKQNSLAGVCLFKMFPIGGDVLTVQRKDMCFIGSNRLCIAFMGTNPASIIFMSVNACVGWHIF